MTLFPSTALATRYQYYINGFYKKYLTKYHTSDFVPKHCTIGLASGALYQHGSMTSSLVKYNAWVIVDESSSDDIYLGDLRGSSRYCTCPSTFGISNIYKYFRVQ